MRRRLTIGIAALLALTGLAAWLARFRVATAFVDRKLAEAQVSASYRLTRIGPLLERMEDVRIGDPARPDLVARRIDVTIGYGLGGPAVRGIAVTGVRLRAGVDEHGVSLGAIDRLLPHTKDGATRLPDLRLALDDAQLMLATPAGEIRASLSGTGNPQRRFTGMARIEAPALRLAACTLDGIASDLRIEAAQGAPSAAGPLRMRHASCAGTVLGAGQAQLTIAFDRALRALTLRAGLKGFAGHAGAARFGGLAGQVHAAGIAGDISGDADLRLQALALPVPAAAARTGSLLTGTPIGPTARQAITAVDRLLAQSDARVRMTGRLTGSHREVHLRQAVLTGAGGAQIALAENGGLMWMDGGWRIDAAATSGGGDLPAMRLSVRQARAGDKLAGTAVLQPYTVAGSRVAATPIRFGWDGQRGTIDTMLTIDGPIGSGFVGGLTLPVRGWVDAGGGYAFGAGCQPVRFTALRLASFRFGSDTIVVCGAPIAVRSAKGRLRLDLRTGPVRLAGRTSAGAPVILAAARLGLNQSGFDAHAVSAALGGPTQSTHLAVATVDGVFRSDMLTGSFTGANGAIGNVPLDIADAGGRWTLDGGVLRLTGNLRVRDAAATARFAPLTTDDAQLRLDGDMIAAAATLREPHGAVIAAIDLRHALTSGAGRALLTVPGVTFVPKGLQPDMLTPLTLGVIANVAGTVRGAGRIDWSPQGVTSSGTFGTERLDLAAAFGPVIGIKGQVRFTDLLGLVSAARQEATVAEVNPGVAVTDGVVHYKLVGQDSVQIEDAVWPFAAGTLRLDPTTLAFGAASERHLTFRLEKVDAAAFVQQLDFPNLSATGTFDGVLPMIFDDDGGRIEAGTIAARPGGGTIAYVGELTTAQLGTMGKLAFDALKAIRYSALDISLDGGLDGEMVSRVRFTGVREATPEQSLVTRLIRNLPFRFNITVRAPFRGLVGSARAYMDPRLLLTQTRAIATPASTTPAEPAVQIKESDPMR